jgi:hypothetical protein
MCLSLFRFKFVLPLTNIYEDHPKYLIDPNAVNIKLRTTIEICTSQRPLVEFGLTASEIINSSHKREPQVPQVTRRNLTSSELPLKRAQSDFVSLRFQNVSTPPAANDGICLAFHLQMTAANIICDHCAVPILNNKAYRVQTEDSGVILLDMIVCYACNLQAQDLGLKTDEIRKPSARVRKTS